MCVLKPRRGNPTRERGKRWIRGRERAREREGGRRKGEGKGLRRKGERKRKGEGKGLRGGVDKDKGIFV